MKDVLPYIVDSNWRNLQITPVEPLDPYNDDLEFDFQSKEYSRVPIPLAK